MITRRLLSAVVALMIFGCGSGQTPPPQVKAQEDQAKAASQATTKLSAEQTAAEQHLVAKPISSSGSGERVFFSPATPEATHGLPLEYNFSDVPKAPKEIMGPSPPIKQE